MKPRRLAPTLLFCMALAGCTAEKREEDPAEKPVRFAVLAAPEVGADDGDLALAVTALSRMPNLAFVLVPGPLLAKDANDVSLELLKNDLGQIAAPVYVAFAPLADVSSGSLCALPKEKVFQALEKFGPGNAHAMSYAAQPERAPFVCVNVLAADGSGTVSPLPAATRRFVQLLASRDVPESLQADLVVGPGESLKTVNPDYESQLLFMHGVSQRQRLQIRSLTTAKGFVVVTMTKERLEAELFPLEGGPKPPLVTAPLPPLRALPTPGR